MVRSTGTVGVVALGWLAAAYLAGAAGLFTTGPINVGLAAGLPVLAASTALVFSPRFRAWAASLDLALLINLQAWRVGGFVFVAFYAQGLLPAGFALPAGLGDVAVAFAAPFVARSSSRRVFLTWTAFGILDLIVAMTLGVLHSPATDVVGQLPLSLIPTFGVPFLLVVHLLSLVGPRSG